MIFMHFCSNFSDLHWLAVHSIIDVNYGEFMCSQQAVMRDGNQEAAGQSVVFISFAGELQFRWLWEDDYVVAVIQLLHGFS